MMMPSMTEFVRLVQGCNGWAVVFRIAGNPKEHCLDARNLRVRITNLKARDYDTSVEYAALAELNTRNALPNDPLTTKQETK